MIRLDVRPLPITDEQFFHLCAANRELHLERTSKGELLIMTPAGGETGRRNSILTGQVWLWNEQTRLGEVFDSSTGFKLPNGAERSPDVAWVARERWESLTPEQKNRFPPICPDFVIELRSPSDNLATIQEKMREYLENGAILGWLIDPERQCIEIYRQGRDVERIEKPERIAGDPILPGLIMDLKRIW